MTDRAEDKPKSEYFVCAEKVMQTVLLSGDGEALKSLKTMMDDRDKAHALVGQLRGMLIVAINSREAGDRRHEAPQGGRG